jgi:hypothetical protein
VKLYVPALTVSLKHVSSASLHHHMICLESKTSSHLHRLLDTRRRNTAHAGGRAIRVPPRAQTVDAECCAPKAVVHISRYGPRRDIKTAPQNNQEWYIPLSYRYFIPLWDLRKQGPRKVLEGPRGSEVVRNG